MGAGSIITRSFSDNVIAAGNLARVLRAIGLDMGA
jgi:acetyltransferase-like isoleucine patch superfamily enzyme